MCPATPGRKHSGSFAEPQERQEGGIPQGKEQGQLCVCHDPLDFLHLGQAQGMLGLDHLTAAEGWATAGVLRLQHTWWMGRRRRSGQR